jgi:hypothetical protein
MSSEEDEKILAKEVGSWKGFEYAPRKPNAILSQEGPRLKNPPKLLGLLRLTHLTMDIFYLALSNIKFIQISYD